MANKLSEIQALRALAIFYVLLYHLNEKWVPLGFLGVDMFFVISGYLMARIFYEKQTSWKSSITFFERRFKRIMPCYALMILCVVLVGRLCLTRIDRDNLFVDAAFSLSIVSNMQSLFTTVDYFELISEYKFLTHSWSLSLEMQFYIFVPLIFWVLQSISDQNKCFLLGIMAGVSALAEMLLPTSIGFGLLLCRLWQFIFGISCHIFNKSEKVNEKEVEDLLESDELNRKTMKGGLKDQVQRRFLSISSLDFDCEGKKLVYFSFFLCVIVPFLFFLNVGFPRVFAVLAATGLIYFSQGEVVTILSTHPLQYIGDISYVVYLVHWPVIAFYRNIWLLEELEWSDYAKLIFIISSLSIFIHHFVERYFLTSDSRVCLYFTILCYALSVLCMALPVSNSFELNLDEQKSNDTVCATLRVYPQPASFENYRHNGEFKESYGELKGNGTFDVMVIGNSYLKSYQAYAEKPFRNRYNKFYMMARGMCTPFVNYDAVNLTSDFRALAEGCEQYNEYLFKTIENVKPKILLMIMGLGKPNDLLDTEANWNRMFQTAKERFQRIKKTAEILLITMPMYYLSNSAAHKYNRIVESGKRFPERNETMYAYKDYITQMKPMLRFLEELAKEIPNLYLVDVQAPFCRDGLTCDVYDYTCGEFFFDWGGRHPTTFARNIVESSLRMRLDQVYSLLDGEMKDQS